MRTEQVSGVMAYAAIVLAFFDHPKYLALMERDPRAVALHLWALAYANDELTDGFLATIQVRRRIECGEPLPLAALLVDVGLWESVEGGFRIHDFLDHNLSAEQVRAKRDATLGRQARWRQHLSGDASVTGDATYKEGVSNASRNALRDASQDGVINGVTNGVINATNARAIASDSDLADRSPVDHDLPSVNARLDRAPAPANGAAPGPTVWALELASGKTGLDRALKPGEVLALQEWVTGPSPPSAAILSERLQRSRSAAKNAVNYARELEDLGNGRTPNNSRRPAARGEVRAAEHMAGAARGSTQWDTPADELQRLYGRGLGEPPASEPGGDRADLPS